MTIVNREPDPVGPLYAELHATLARARWLKRACIALLILDISALFALWLTRTPLSLGL